MTRPTPGKHRAETAFALTRAECIGADACGKVEQTCPRHESHAYAKLNGRHGVGAAA